MKLNFYWWERISAASLRHLGELRKKRRWPFPPIAYDVQWIET